MCIRDRLQGKRHLPVKATSRRQGLLDPALGWSDTLSVQVGGAGTVAAAGVVLPRLLADRLGLCTDLADVVARSGFFPIRHRGRALIDMACSMAAGATCLSDIEAMTAQEEIFGPGGGASDSTLLRVLDELCGQLRADGLPGRRLARATARARAKAWAEIVARHGQLPAVKVAGKDLTRPAAESGGRPRPVLAVRLDATLIEAASGKDKAAGTFKQGFGFHPLTAWATNIGDALAVMLRPGNAGSFTASDHIAVLKAAFTQIPADWRTDVLVSIDGAGASHEIIDHLTGLNTYATHGLRGRRVEYTIGWPVDERTLGGIAELREGDWGFAVEAAGKLGEDPDWEYGAFVTNTAGGQVQWLDARHRTQAHVEDRMKQIKACGARNLPSSDWHRYLKLPRSCSPPP